MYAPNPEPQRVSAPNGKKCHAASRTSAGIARTRQDRRQKEASSSNRGRRRRRTAAGPCRQRQGARSCRAQDGKSSRQRNGAQTAYARSQENYCDHQYVHCTRWYIRWRRIANRCPVLRRAHPSPPATLCKSARCRPQARQAHHVSRRQLHSVDFVQLFLEVERLRHSACACLKADDGVCKLCAVRAQHSRSDLCSGLSVAFSCV